MVKPLKRARSLTPRCGQERYRKERTCKTVEKKTSENVVTGVCPTCGDPGQIQGLLLHPEWAGTLKGDPCGGLSLDTHLGFPLQTQTVVHEPDGGSVLVTAMQWLMFCIIQVPPSGPLEQLVPPHAGSDGADSHRCLSLYGLTCTRDKAPPQRSLYQRARQAGVQVPVPSSPFAQLHRGCLSLQPYLFHSLSSSLRSKHTGLF